MSHFLLLCVTINRYCADFQIADHIRDFGPAIYWWAFPIERYIGNLKARLSNMSSIDANLVHAALRMELLHHLYRDLDTSLPVDFLVLGPRVPSHYTTDISANRSRVSVLPRGVK